MSLGPVDVLDEFALEEQLMEEAFLEIDVYLEEAGLKGAVVVMYEERGLVVRFLDTILFPRAKADLL
ncbi:MAG TPA: chemotaxis protein MotB, partial [Firmicutes bacterium]|nr:chemotaxis protein MotB [Bacillota bacterium]